MSQPLAAHSRLCPQCKAGNEAQAKTCWLCHAPLSASDEVVTAELVKQSPLKEGFFLILTLCCVVLLLLVGVGLANGDPGLLIPYAIVLAPALLATIGRTLMTVSKGQRTSASQVFLTFFASAAITIGISIVLAAAAIVALFIYLLYVCGQMLGH